MKFARLLCLCLLSNTIGVAQNNAHITTGNKLREKCKLFFAGQAPPTMTDMERIDTGYCAGYLDGATEVEQEWSWVEGKSSKATHYCLPKEATKGQMFLVVKKWMDEHPEELHKSADIIIHKAFLKAFPCKCCVPSR
jgi:hypothetical protein